MSYALSVPIRLRPFGVRDVGSTLPFGRALLVAILALLLALGFEAPFMASRTVGVATSPSGVTRPAHVPAAAQGTLASAPPALRRAVVSVLGGSRVAPLTTSFSADGARIGSTGGSWQLTVGLGSVGRAGQLQPVPSVQPTQQAGDTVYRSGDVTESFSKSSGGIEQTLRLSRRPGGRGPLVVDLPVSGLVAQSASGGALALEHNGQKMLGYRGLQVTDTTGARIPARLSTSGGAVRIVVDDDTARYPLTIDPTWTQQAELSASDGAPDDDFAGEIALSGSTALIGAQEHMVGTNAGQGAVYVFTESGGIWTQQAELTASDGAANAGFGRAISLSGTTALIGAYGANDSQGAAYVFTESGGTWTQQAELTASDGPASTTSAIPFR